MSKRATPALLAGTLAALGGTPALADGVLERLELSAMIESETALGTSSGDLQKAELVVTPEIGFDLTPSMRLTVIGRLRIDLEDDLEPGRPPQTSRSVLSRRLFVGDHGDVALREAYVDTEIGGTFLRLGKQQVVWGQADGLKVLDVLNPQSFREFILPDFEDSRIPLWMVNAEIPVGAAFLQIVWIPDRTYDDIPVAGATFAFTSPLIVPPVPAGVPVIVRPIVRPDDFLGDSDVGVRLSGFRGGWDLTLNYAYHYFDRPVVRREITPAAIIVRQSYARTHTLGGTFSTVVGDFTLRGEVGFSSDRFFLTNDPGDADGVERSGEVSYVLGLDYAGWRDWFISAQIFQSIVTGNSPGLVRDPVESTATLLVRRDFLNDALQAEVLIIHSLNVGDGVVQAKLDYEWRSDVHIKLGFDLFYGPSQGLFGQFDARDRLSLALAFGF